MFGLMKRSTSEYLLKTALEQHQAILEKQTAYYEERFAKEYQRALTDLSAQLRELLVDTNYELYHTNDSFLRGRVYAFMAHGLALFHEKVAKTYE